jgi:hypothetical protein
MKGLDVARDGPIWVAGTVLRNGTRAYGVVWSRAKDGNNWTEIASDDVDLSSVSASADGAVFAAGRSVWKLDADQFTRVADKEEVVESLWAASSKRVWIARGGVRFVRTGSSETAVGIDSTEPMVRRGHGSGSHVWAVSANRVWQLLKDEDASPPTKLVIKQPE